MRRWIGFSKDDGRAIAEGARYQPRKLSGVVANALRTTHSTYNPINSRTYFTGGLP
jgi:hypothetical protein